MPIWKTANRDIRTSHLQSTSQCSMPKRPLGALSPSCRAAFHHPPRRIKARSSLFAHCSKQQQRQSLYHFADAYMGPGFLQVLCRLVCYAKRWQRLVSCRENRGTFRIDVVRFVAYSIWYDIRRLWTSHNCGARVRFGDRWASCRCPLCFVDKVVHRGLHAIDCDDMSAGCLWLLIRSTLDVGSDSSDVENATRCI
jgi:hypothetical protein